MTDGETELLIIVPDDTTAVDLNDAGRVVEAQRAHELEIEGCSLRVRGLTVLFLEREPASFPDAASVVAPAAGVGPEEVELCARGELSEVTIAALGIIGLQNFGHLDDLEHEVAVGGWRGRVRHQLSQVVDLPSDETGHRPSETHWRVYVGAI